MAAEINLSAAERFAVAVDPIEVPCPVRVCSADPGMRCKPNGLRYHDERWQVAIVARLEADPAGSADLLIELFGGLPGAYAGRAWNEIKKVLDSALPDPEPDEVPSLGRVLETLEANKEGTLPALVAALDALGDWHPVLEIAHAVGEWRWVLSDHPRAR